MTFEMYTISNLFLGEMKVIAKNRRVWFCKETKIVKDEKLKIIGTGSERNGVLTVTILDPDYVI